MLTVIEVIPGERAGAALKPGSPASCAQSRPSHPRRASRGRTVARMRKPYAASKAWEQAGNKVDFDPAAHVLSKLGEATICAAIESLPADFRVVVTLADLEELSYEEIAEAVQVPIGTVKSRLYRGRKQVQKRLWEYMQEGYSA